MQVVARCRFRRCRPELKQVIEENKWTHAGPIGQAQASRNDDAQSDVPHLARRQAAGRASRTTRPRSARAWSCSTPCTASRRSRPATSPCGGTARREVRLVLGRDQRQAAADVHDAARHDRPDAAGHRRADEGVPARSGTSSPTCRGTTRSRRRSSRSSRASPMRRTAPGGCSSAKSIACRSSASASSASSARTSATSCATITCTTGSSARGSCSTTRRSRCIRSTPRIGSRDLKDRDGVGYCNITRCCTKVCPEHITITENAIIPLKERVVDRFYDPLTRLLRVFRC